MLLWKRPFLYHNSYLNVVTDFDASPVLPFLFIETSGCHFFLNAHTHWHKRKQIFDGCSCELTETVLLD